MVGTMCIAMVKSLSGTCAIVYTDALCSLFSGSAQAVADSSTGQSAPHQMPGYQTDAYSKLKRLVSHSVYEAAF